MNDFANAALTSWTLNPPAIALLIGTALIYLRGWLRGRRLLLDPADYRRLWSFLAGLAIVFVATESPLDAFDNLYLSAHMTQHLLLMMFAPPLILLGHPTLPLLRGLPKRFVKEGLGPFLSWPLLKKISGVLVLPPVTWAAFAFSSIFWHLPKFYELALSSPFWHAAQHASFFWTGILFWWPVIQPSPAKPRWPLWTKIPYLLFADIVNTGISAMFVFSGRLLYPSYNLARASSFGALDDQIVAGLIMWVPGSIVYLVPAFMLAMRLLSPTSARSTASLQRLSRNVPIRRAPNRFRLPRLRRAAQFAMLLLSALVIADGWIGPQVAPLNLAGVLPWIHWRALSILALLAVGNLFCLSCPFTLFRDFGRKILPAKFRWPRPLRNKWLPAALLILYLWSYEAFGLWDSPFLTASIIAGYFAAALLIDGFFRGASFCKYVCPIGQFHFVSSLVSPREVTIKSAAICQSCRTYDCIRGNEKARGCELYLFQPKKSGNLDCTFCLDCVKACPHDNVALLPVLPAKSITEDPYRSSIGRLSKRTDLAALTLVFVFGAFANAAGMVSPVMRWEHGWHARFGPHAMPLAVAVFIVACVVLIPALAIAACALLNRPIKKSGIAALTRRLIFTLVPLGFAMWGAHLLYHFATGWSAPWAILQGRFFDARTTVTMPFIPGWLTAAQIVFLDAGLLLTLYTCWRVVRQSAAHLRGSIALLTPWATLAVALYCAGAWILFQPMQMRGMIH
ncbi:MAG: cytochrome c oxidase assembly protein [Acidobacteriota bacterium]|nr:cytochrome c oxidase assembly protein [Acidobacteriota bacterium]